MWSMQKKKKKETIDFKFTFLIDFKCYEIY